jgi:transporter family-2 protein
LGLSAGASLVVQAVLNTRLRTMLASWAWTGLASYLGGTATMIAVLLVVRHPWPTRLSASEVPWPAWTGGFFGAVFIVLTVLLVPRMGVAPFIGLMVAGQLLTSITFDHYALFGLAQHPVTATRLFGAAFLVTGVVLMRI